MWKVRRRCGSGSRIAKDPISLACVGSLVPDSCRFTRCAAVWSVSRHHRHAPYKHVARGRRETLSERPQKYPVDRLDTVNLSTSESYGCRHLWLAHMSMLSEIRLKAACFVARHRQLVQCLPKGGRHRIQIICPRFRS